MIATIILCIVSLCMQARMTALHLGVSGGHVETVKELASRADPSAINAIDGVRIYTTCVCATCM